MELPAEERPPTDRLRTLSGPSNPLKRKCVYDSQTLPDEPLSANPVRAETGHRIYIILIRQRACYQIEVKLPGPGRYRVLAGRGRLFSATCWVRTVINGFCNEPEWGGAQAVV